MMNPHDDSLSTPTSGSFLVTSGSSLMYSPKISTDQITMAEPFKKEIAKIVKDEIEKICFELYVAGSLPLTEQAKEYFAKKL